METIKIVLGFVELAFSLKFLSVADLAYGWHIMDREVFLSLWIVIFGLLGLYLIGKLKFQVDAIGGDINKPMPVACIMLGLCFFGILGLHDSGSLGCSLQGCERICSTY